MVDANKWLDAILNNRQPMEPIPTSIAPRLAPLDGIRAVIFDIYGTLIISGCGEIGTTMSRDPSESLAAAFAAVDGPVSDGPASSESMPQVEQLYEQIRGLNSAALSEECPHPEVDIVEAWRRTLVAAGRQELAERTELVHRLAAEYESRANPTWPMPGADELIRKLAAAGLPLGIVSNAQVFTQGLVEDLTSAPLLASGFALDLCVLSYRFRQAKPAPRLFEVLRRGLDRAGVAPAEAIYVGNDMLNDVWAASQAGLRTAWFAGDERSCRARADDARCEPLQPDLVLTELTQLVECLQVR